MLEKYSTVFIGRRVLRFRGAEVERIRSLMFEHGENLWMIIDNDSGYYAKLGSSGSMGGVCPTKQEAEYAERVLNLISE